MYHGPYQKGLDRSYLHVYACLHLCFMLVLASLVLGFATFGALRGLDLMWLHLTPMRPCSDVTIWEASPNSGLLRADPYLFRFARCYAYHAYVGKYACAQRKINGSTSFIIDNMYYVSFRI